MTTTEQLIEKILLLIDIYGNRKLKSEIAQLESEIEKEKITDEHETCDGCKFFQDCGCMLDDSCPPCFEYSSWTPKKKKKEKITNNDIEAWAKNYFQKADDNEISCLIIGAKAALNGEIPHIDV